MNNNFQHQHTAHCESGVMSTLLKSQGVDFNEAAFRKFLKNNLDNYKRPRDIEFMEELPKNSLRKILKKDLRKDAVEKLKSRLVPVTSGDDL